MKRVPVLVFATVAFASLFAVAQTGKPTVGIPPAPSGQLLVLEREGAFEDASGSTEATTIEAITMDGDWVISVKSKGVAILARSFTIDGIKGPTIKGLTTFNVLPEGILEMKHEEASMNLNGGKLELLTELTITKMDLIRLELAPKGKVLINLEAR